ncbi:MULTISPECIES: SLC13 family permease [Actinoalloteichus]|uniref:Di-/tricarboxylate transporter n=1 Tax=Actinoalloteichus fjordicus TaxID=1612552 RepID=A0AAC9PTU8_9PSEU|nr:MULTISPECIES: SLC13 family permease [Actinoalloteichus]APU16385.1 di-/tricarboxylate transporter [Actinoalloteichus fjordicus]APU22443.1 di-/tricarboxylate transporter [Actinoalloteichus sp. GBA129-24]
MLVNVTELDTDREPPLTVYATTPPPRPVAGRAGAFPAAATSRVSPRSRTTTTATSGNAATRRTPTAASTRRASGVRLVGLLVPVAGAITLTVLYTVLPGPDAGLPAEGRVTLVVFAGAVLAWTCTRWDDTFVALAAALTLTLIGVLTADELFGSLGGDVIWLLIAAFVLAAGLTAAGLPERLAVALLTRARTVRGLVHLLTAALVGSALLVPATSGRAALALPVFLAVARTLSGRERVVRALALLIPTVILLSAVATLTGAGAHLITVEVLRTATGSGIGFGAWLLAGLPLAVLSSHLAAELVLLLMTRRADRRERLVVRRADLVEQRGAGSIGPDRMRPDRRAKYVLVLVGLVAVAWCTETWHGVEPAVIALIGALAVAAPGIGTVSLTAALRSVPWSLLMFMAATAVLGGALLDSGAADWLMTVLLSGIAADEASAAGFLVAVVALSTAAHLVLQSRSARSSVLIPLLLPAAVVFGLNPAAVAFASTAAAGFCHTLPSSAKPVAMFADLGDVPGYGRRDLLRLSVFLAPLLAALVIGFAWFGWPYLGLPLR